MKSVSHIILATLLAGGGTALANEQIDFQKHDANRDGKLSQQEWSDVGRIDVSFSQLDRNSDQQLSKQEVRNSRLQLASGQQSQQKSQQGKQAFQQADENRDRKLSRDEARNAGYDYVVMYYDPIDADGNGYLDENEWDLNETGAGIYDDGVSNTGTANSDNNRNNQDGWVDVGAANDGFMEWNEDSFNTFDANDDGYLDDNEVADYDYVDSNFDTWDVNDDGLLEEDEVADTWYNEDDELGEDF